MKTESSIGKTTNPNSVAVCFKTACAAKLLALMPLLLLTLAATVQAQFDYTTNNGEITITGCAGSSGAAIIPSTINGLPVTSIGDFVGPSCPQNLTNFTIPDGVTSIGECAFWNCTSLISVTIPNSVTRIGLEAFSRCTSLTSVTIGNSVTSIGDRAFYLCDHLPRVTIGNSVTSIGMGAFVYCTSLASVTIPNSVTRIGDGAFSFCTSLTSVNIPNSVTRIGAGAFSYCASLSAITVDALNSFYSSVDGVLFNKSQTTFIQYPEAKAGSYTVPNSVTSIGDSAFGKCSSLTSVTIPNSVTSIGSDAFNGCTKLTSITIPNSVTNIGYFTFENCTSLTGVYFKGNAPSVGSGVFDAAGQATVYYLPGTTGWGATFAGRLPRLWIPQVQTSDANFSVYTNQFGFNITGISDLVVVVEACTNLANPAWTALETNILTGGSSYFSDPQWTNYPGRFYRLSSP